MSAHYTPEAEEVLLKTAEEAGEVVQAVAKMLQHGPYSHNPDNPMQGNNRRAFSKELGDMLGLIKWCFEQGLVDHYVLQEAARTKMQRVAQYAHHIQVHPGYVPMDL